METVPTTVAFLHEGELDPEQEAALTWCERAVDVVEPVTFDDIVVGRADLSTFDSCWWHRDHPVGPETGRQVAAVADDIAAFLDDGGGLLLSLHALSAVEPLGIDDVPPDESGVDHGPEPTGFAVRRLHREHPAFESLDARVHTRDPANETPFVAYGTALPSDGDVLACDLRGDDLDVGRKSVVEWRVGDGLVLGVGAGLSFGPGPEPRAEADAEAATDGGPAGPVAAVDRLVRNGLALGDGRQRTVSGRPTDAAGMSDLRESLGEDHHRPSYHLTAPANWLNDPNGLVEWNGSYHVFYQYNPGGPFHGSIHWGHAVSDDLVHWRDEPVALAPSTDGPDRDGVWSGCAVVDDDGTPTAVYTGGRGRHQLPCLATALDDDLRVWEKHDGNPVIDETADGLDLIGDEHWETEFRDHCVWRASEGAGKGPVGVDAAASADTDVTDAESTDETDDGWYHLIGSGVEGVGGTALLYRGDSLDDWEFVGPLLTGDWDGAGDMWECPELLDLGEKQLLHVSNYEVVQYYLGEADLDAPAFDVEREGLLDYGALYAPQSMTTSDGRILVWGWLVESRDADAQWEAGWSGALSLPRELSLGDDGRLRQRPAAEVERLREERVVEAAPTLSAGERRDLGVDSSTCELRADLSVAAGATVELAVRESPARSRRVPVRFDGETVEVDRRPSTDAPGVDTGIERMPVGDGGGRADGADGEADDANGRNRVSLRLFVDGSVLELFVNERRALATRVYPDRTDARGVSVAAEGGEVAFDRLDAWTLGSAWE